MHVRLYVPYCLLLFSFLSLVSCSNTTNTIRSEELHSELQSAISLASETQWFIGQIQEGRVTPQFSKSHLDYLSVEAMRSRKELSKMPSDSSIAQTLEASRIQVDSLVKQLTILKADLSNPRILFASNEQIAQIRHALEDEKEQQ